MQSSCASTWRLVQRKAVTRAALMVPGLRPRRPLLRDRRKKTFLWTLPDHSDVPNVGGVTSWHSPFSVIDGNVTSHGQYCAISVGLCITVQTYCSTISDQPTTFRVVCLCGKPCPKILCQTLPLTQDTDSLCFDITYYSKVEKRVTFFRTSNSQNFCEVFEVPVQRSSGTWDSSAVKFRSLEFQFGEGQVF